MELRGSSMRKGWILGCLFLVGCTQAIVEPVVEEVKVTPQQQLTQVQEEILSELQQEHLILGETQQQDLQDYEQLDEKHFTYAGIFNVAIQTMDGLIDRLTVTLLDSIVADNIETTFVVEDDVQGEWLVEQGMVTALQLMRTEPTFKQLTKILLLKIHLLKIHLLEI